MGVQKKKGECASPGDHPCGGVRAAILLDRKRSRKPKSVSDGLCAGEEDGNKQTQLLLTEGRAGGVRKESRNGDNWRKKVAVMRQIYPARS